MLLHRFVVVFIEMREGRLNYETFCEEAELLQRRSHEVASKKEVGGEAYVVTWEWRHGNRQVRNVGEVVE